jgi:hypothetical protein
MEFHENLTDSLVADTRSPHRAFYTFKVTHPNPTHTELRTLTHNHSNRTGLFPICKKFNVRETLKISTNYVLISGVIISSNNTIIYNKKELT